MTSLISFSQSVSLTQYWVLCFCMSVCLPVPSSLFRGFSDNLNIYHCRTFPGTAIIHFKQFTTIGMVTRMTGSLLHKHAVHVLTSLQRSTNVWFFIIHKLCIQYGLPHPLDLLQNPPTIISYKKKGKAYMAYIGQEQPSIRNMQLVSSNCVHSTHLCEANKCWIFKPFFLFIR